MEGVRRGVETKPTNRTLPFIFSAGRVSLFWSFLFLLPSLLGQAERCIARRFLSTMTLGDFTAQMQIGFKGKIHCHEAILKEWVFLIRLWFANANPGERRSLNPWPQSNFGVCKDTEFPVFVPRGIITEWLFYFCIAGLDSKFAS